MKAHPGFFATLVSAFVAGVAFILNAALYQRTEEYLQYWGFGRLNVDVTIGHQIYILTITLLFCVASAFITIFLCETFSVYQKQARILYYLRLCNKRLFRKLWLGKLDAWWTSVIIKFKELKYGKSNELEQLKNRLKNSRKNISEISEGNKITSDVLLTLRKENAKQLFPSLLAANILTFLYLLAYIYIEIEELAWTKTSFGIALGITLFLNILIYILVKLEYAFLNPEMRQIKQAIKRDQCEQYQMIIRLAETSAEKYPMTTIIKSKPSDLFTNKRIALVMLLVICSLFSVSFLFSGGKEEFMSDLRTFATTQIDDQSYAIIYNNGTTYYLSEAEINGDTLAINTERQRIFVSNDLIFEITNYSNVIKLPQPLSPERNTVIP